MKQVLLLVLCLPLLVAAQDRPLMIEGSSPNLFLSHKVVPKENFYSIGRLYNISPKQIAPFNKIQMEKGINPGQVLKIPLEASNFSQNGVAADDEVLVPLYYTVKEKEGLYRIGIVHNKLPLETLKKWNNIKTDVVNKGAKLIVGYLKVKKGQSAYAVKGKAGKQEDKAITTAKIPDEKKPEIKEVPPVKNEDKEKIIVEPDETKEPAKPGKDNEPVKVKSIAGTDFSGGVFKELFESQTNGNVIIKEEGSAGVFKSTSGWTDGKYYCLHNTATAGTIIKITNTANGKSVYAKVLDVMPDIKQNTGLLIRISNSAAHELEVADMNFNCTLNFSK